MKNSTIYKKIDIIVEDLKHFTKAPSQYIKRGSGGFSRELFLMDYIKFECGVEHRVSEYLTEQAQACLKYLRRQEDIDKFLEIIELTKKLTY